MSKMTFLRGTIFLSSAAFIARVLGFVCSIFLARMLGAEGIGLLMMAQPLVPLLITLTELGLPVAISKLVAEAEVTGDRMRIKRILKVSLAITGILSVTLTTLTLLGSQAWAGWLLADERAYYAMLAITPIAPIIAISAVLKGYFRGRQKMMSIAFSDVLENMVQIFCMLALVHVLLPYGLQYAVAGAMASAVISELCSMLFLYSRYRRQQDAALSFSLRASMQESKTTLAQLLRIGLPTTGHGFVHSIYGAFQPLLVTKSLVLAGVGATIATSQYGMLVGYAFPLLMMPGFITHSMSTALIPAISEASARRDSMMMHQLMEQAMRIALLVGVPSTVILYTWAVPLADLVYQSPEAGRLLHILAPVFILHYFDAPLHAILLGMGRATTAMWNYVIATGCKAAAIFLLGTQFGIEGVAIAINFGICVLTFLNFFSISQLLGFYIHLNLYIRAGVGMGAMLLCGVAADKYLQSLDLPTLVVTLGAIGLSLLIYLAVWRLTMTNRRKSKAW